MKSSKNLVNYDSPNDVLKSILFKDSGNTNGENYIFSYILSGVYSSFSRLVNSDFISIIAGVQFLIIKGCILKK